MDQIRKLYVYLLATLILIPAIASGQERVAIEDFVQGFPMQLGTKARAASLPDLLAGGDEAVYFAALHAALELGVS